MGITMITIMRILMHDITGQLLDKLKTNEQFSKTFQAKIENASFGMWIAISTAIYALK